MLSIGKLTPGRASYYAEQLPGGADEYYTRGDSEVPAVWLGSACGRLELEGRVDPAGFRLLLDAADPRTGDPLGVPRTTSHRLAGFDLCFSSPKSVSVLWGLADPDTAGLIAAAHDRAVAEAVDVFEAEVVRARRGSGAVTLIDTEGVVAAAFGHRSSRAGDPQLHTHVVVANMTVDADGRWTALAGDRVYRWAKTLGYLYQASLRAALTESLGVSWGPVRKGAAEIAGVRLTLIGEFSKRRSQIVAAMNAAGVSSSAGAEVAALATRPAKDGLSSLSELRGRWQARSAEFGIDIETLLGRPRPAADRTVEVSAAMLRADGLTAHTSTFDRRDVLQALAAGHAEGIHPAQVRLAADRLTARSDVVHLTTRRGVGAVYSTAELLDVEGRLVAWAARRVGDGVGMLRAASVAEVIACRPMLSDEQKAMVAKLLSSGAGVEIVVGRAGSGKTFALDAARAAWQSGGYHVIGAALAARAAAELQAGSGIASTTVDRLLGELDRPGPLCALRPGTVIVVDEAAMVGTRKLARLAAHAERGRAKLVLIGDHRQLPEIEAGGAFSALGQVVPVSELAGNRRQVHLWEREALSALRAGSTLEAVTAYRSAGRVTVAPDADTVRERMVDDWWLAHRQDGQAAMYALRRADVEDLNLRARARLDAAGRLGPQRLDVAGRQFALGDEVICGRNDRRLGVRNGTRSTVADLDVGAGTVTLSDGAVLPSDYLEGGYLAHSYATTVHKAQGATVNHAFLLGSDAVYREAGYVGLSRGRESNRLYVVAGDTSRATNGPNIPANNRPGMSNTDVDRARTGGPYQAQPNLVRPSSARLNLASPDPLAETIRLLGQSKAQRLASDQLDVTHARRASLTEERVVTLADPPAWLTDTIGPPPVTETGRERWALLAERLAAYRETVPGHDLDRSEGASRLDDSSVLGPRPTDPERGRAYDLARMALFEGRHLEAHQPPGPDVQNMDGHDLGSWRSVDTDRGLGL